MIIYVHFLHVDIYIYIYVMCIFTYIYTSRWCNGHAYEELGKLQGLSPIKVSESNGFIVGHQLMTLVVIRLSFINESF